MRDTGKPVQPAPKKTISRREFMARTAALGISIAAMTSLFTNQAIASPPEVELAALAKGMVWTGQASVKIPGLGAKVYVDPYKIKEDDRADLVLITHSHKDHLSLSSLEKICWEQTTIVTTQDVASKISGISQKETLVVKPGDRVRVDRISVEAVPMYNITKGKYHPKSKNWAGYVITGNGVRIYHAGDTERIPEMKAIRCDITLLPLGQKYTMNSVEESAQAARDVRAKIAVPIHFGINEGSDSDALKFRELLAGTADVVILDRVQ